MTTELSIPAFKQKLSSDRKWVERALIVLAQFQTDQEYNSEATVEKNHVGFNGVDAKLLTSFAKQLSAGHHLSLLQLDIAQKKLPKYAGQLLTIAQTKKDKSHA